MKDSGLTLKHVSAFMGLIIAIHCFRAMAQPAPTVLSGKEAAVRMEAAQNEVANLRSNILITLVELDKVRGERNPARPQFQAFTNQLARMEELAKTLANRAEQMRQRGKAYFADWEAQTAVIQDPQQRRLAEERYGERKASYDSINTAMQEAKKNFIPFVAEVRSIKDILEKPLEQHSLLMAKDLFMRANWHSIDVQRALMQAEAEFDRLAVSFGQNQ